MSMIETNSLLAIPIAYFAGVFVSFTPCVFPLIPVTLSFIGSRKAETKLKAFLISLVYVIGIATTYAALGAVASLGGSVFGTLTQKPGVYLFVGNIFFLLGLNMLGVLHLRLPSFGGLQNIKAGSDYVTAFIVGIVSGLVIGPCTAPALGAILVYVATKQNVIFGIVLLFVFALGMGTILILTGTFAGIIKLKAGAWMENVERVFGWLLILAGEYFILRAGQLWF